MHVCVGMSVRSKKKESDVISFKQKKENKQGECQREETKNCERKNKSNTMNIVFDYRTAHV